MAIRLQVSACTGQSVIIADHMFVHTTHTLAKCSNAHHQAYMRVVNIKPPRCTHDLRVLAYM